MDPLETINGRKVHVLLIEDDLTLSDMYKEKFSMVNCDITVCADGEEGLHKTLSEHPDVLLLDLALPTINGLFIMKQLRQDEWGKTLPIIILTNLNPNDAILNEVIAHQPAYYLIKANTVPDDVVEKVKEILHLKA
ncbi:MAG: response regulator [Patescibacteria group bacterium]|nr:response regulator [Patescibacteria group bacterium]MDE2590810.1 response regulator [Patescibacteria group bacterium]